MAGFSKIYCVGGLGGFQGADGVNPIFFRILVGNSDRQWLQVHYFDQTIKPIGRLRQSSQPGLTTPMLCLMLV